MPIPILEKFMESIDKIGTSADEAIKNIIASKQDYTPTKYNAINGVKEDVFKNLETYNEFISVFNRVKKMLELDKSALTSEQLTHYIPDVTVTFGYLSMYKSETDLTDEDIVQIICLLIKSNANFLLFNEEFQTVRQIFDEQDKILASSYINLHSCFNDDGTCVKNVDKKTVLSNIEKIFATGQINDNFAKSFMDSLNFLTEDGFMKILKRNIAKANKKDEPTKVVETKHELTEEEKKLYDERLAEQIKNRQKQNKENRFQERQEKISREAAIMELSQYYLDGEIIAIPESSEYFKSLLERSGYREEKIDLIINKLHIFISELELERVYKKYMTEEEYNLFIREKNNSTIDSVMYYIGEIESAIMLLEETNEEQEKQELQMIITNSFDQINNILKVLENK